MLVNSLVCYSLSLELGISFLLLTPFCGVPSAAEDSIVVIPLLLHDLAPESPQLM